MIENHQDDVMTLKGVAEYLERSKAWLYKLVSSGKGYCQKVGRSWKFKREEIEKWQKERHLQQSHLLSENASREQIVKKNGCVAKIQACAVGWRK